MSLEITLMCFGALAILVAYELNRPHSAPAIAPKDGDEPLPLV